MKVLSIVETAYRATLEEQDDTVLWFSHSVRSAGADIDLLLQGNAANYAVRDQDASGLAFGDQRQTQPPRIANDLAKLIAAGVTVYAVREDAAARGLDPSELIDGIEWIHRSRAAALIGNYERVWYW
jgi:intracellular sulfur oxidation DsrE/DsrF family protein